MDPCINKQVHPFILSCIHIILNLIFFTLLPHSFLLKTLIIMNKYHCSRQQHHQDVYLRFSWTRADLETACRQLGFQGGAWWGWFDRQPGFQPRLLFEEPKCKGTETSLFECNWPSRQLGAGVCGECYRELFV